MGTDCTISAEAEVKNTGNIGIKTTVTALAAVRPRTDRGLEDADQACEGPF